jgi:hypothetical protein
MKKYINFTFIIILFLASFMFACKAQTFNTLKNQCPNSQIYQTLTLLNNGDINAIPCPGGNFQINGVNVIAGAGGGTISGSGTATRFPVFTNGTTIGNSPYIWNGTNYTWDNTALNSEFGMLFRPDSASGTFRVGDFATTPTYFFTLAADGSAQLSGNDILIGNSATGGNNTQIDVNDLSQVVSITGGTGTAAFDFGQSVFAFSDSSGYNFSLDAASGIFSITGGTSTGTFSSTGINTFLYNRTNAGSTGNQVINKPVGSVQFAAAASDLTVTNNTVNANSLIFCTVQSNDTTAKGCYVSDRTSGSFHIRLSSAATATTVVAFMVTN